MSLSLSLSLSLGNSVLNNSISASAYASGPAPTGYRWDFVTQNGIRATQNNEPIVALVRAT